MAFAIPYAHKTLTVSDFVVPGNSTSSAPVEIDIEPADGPDRARIRSIYVATLGTGSDRFSWTPDAQAMVAAAFKNARGVFNDTVRAVRNLSVPAALAVRCGLIPDLPTKVIEGGDVVPDRERPIAVATGVDFDRVVQFFLPLALYTALEVAEISNAVAIDPRFFEQRSGSPGPAKPRTRPSTAGSVPPASGAGATAASRPRQAASRKRGTHP